MYILFVTLLIEYHIYNFIFRCNSQNQIFDGL